MDPSATHPDPFGESLQHGVHRVVEITSIAVAGAQMYQFQRRTQARIVAERDDRGRRALHTQVRAEREAARAGWAPALDPAWLRRANLMDVARAWGSALPYADRSVPWYEPAAATAMRKCEERLRELHPFAMARYDRLRDQGLGPAEAMAEAAPLFAGPARAHDAPSTPRPMLPAGAPGMGAADLGDEPGRRGPGGVPSPGDTGPEPPVPADPAGAPGKAAAGGVADAAADTWAVLSPGDTATRTAAARAASARVVRPLRPWERDFPMPIRDVLAAVSGMTSLAPARTPAKNLAQRLTPAHRSRS